MKHGLRTARATILVILAATATGTLQAAGPPGGGSHSEIWRFLARFHFVLLHLPIGFLALAFLLDVYSWLRPGEEVRRILGFVLLLTTAGALVVASLGWLLSREGTYDSRTLFLHRWLGCGVVAFTCASWWMHRRARRRGFAMGPVLAYRLTLSLTLVLLTAAGHFGGNLTHGSEYLVEYAPGFLKELIAEAAGPATEPRTAGTGLYAEKIQPLLGAKCLRCHGVEKQKGGYRLDVREDALRGGESGVPAIVPGEPLRSHLVELILHDPEHEDVMPPTGKDPLLPEEVLTIIRWIEAGAPFGSGSAPSQQATSGPTPQPAPPLRGADAVAAVGAPPPARVEFERDILPILSERCATCHGPKRQKGSLSLETLALARAGGEGEGPAVVPGRAGESALVRRISVNPSSDPDEELMPPARKGGPLPAAQVALLCRWIDEGAPWPEGAHVDTGGGE